MAVLSHPQPAAQRSPGSETAHVISQTAGPHRSARIPGLDGLRGVAVAMVLTYHLWPGLLPGGFLGVTVFFALSGYLITRLLVEEKTQVGRIDIAAFYRRRARRLLPVAVGSLALVTLIWTLTGNMTRGLQREMTYSLVQMANWGQYFTGQRYGGSEASPIVHYWSLAIEEQTYLVVPLLVLLLSRRRLAVAIAVGLGISLYLTLAADGDPVVVYYSTLTRVGEFGCGAGLALWRLSPSARGTRLRGICGLTAIAALLLAARLVSTTTEALYSGGLLVAGLLAAFAVWSLAHSPSFGRRLDIWPLAALGKISYGVYVYHWPILIGLGLTGLGSTLVSWVTLVSTLVLAAASYRWIEAPLQRSRSPIRLLLAGVAVAGIAAFSLSIWGASRDTSVDFEDLAQRFEIVLNDRVTAPIAPITTTPGSGPVITQPPIVSGDGPQPVTGPLTMSYFGDSKALTLAFGLSYGPPADWQLGPSFAPLGCPLARGGSAQHQGAPSNNAPWELKGCDWMTYIDDAPATPVDVVMLWYGTWDVVERKVPALGDEWLSFDSPEYRRYIIEELETLIAALRAKFDPELILMLTISEGHEADPELRSSSFNTLWTRYAETTDLPFRVLDIAAWVEASGEATRLMPDGFHLTYGEIDPLDNTALEVHYSFLDPETRRLLAEIRELNMSRPNPARP
jgi:peptidoglycan/LPS O-acetylase OafA/YrhL